MHTSSNALQLGLAAIALSTATLGLPAAYAGASTMLQNVGVSTVEGSAGGGLSLRTVISGPSAEGEIENAAFIRRTVTRDYELTAAGVAIGLNDRVELSFGHQDFNTLATDKALGRAALHLNQDTLGAMWRATVAVLDRDSDTRMPQIAVGVQHKCLRSSELDRTLQLGYHLNGSMHCFVYGADTDGVIKISARGLAPLSDVPEGAALLRVWHPDQAVEVNALPVKMQVQASSALTVPTQAGPQKRRM